MLLFKKSFIITAAFLMTAMIGAPTLGGQLNATAIPKAANKDLGYIRVSTGWGYRGYAPYRYYAPGYRYHYYAPYHYRPYYRYYWGGYGW